MNLPKEVRLDSLILKLSQKNDGMDEGTFGQDLTVEIVECGAGFYAVIKTERWALDVADLEHFLDLLHQVVSFMNSQGMAEEKAGHD